MGTIAEQLDGHITLEVECLDRLYLNGYIGNWHRISNPHVDQRSEVMAIAFPN